MRLQTIVRCGADFLLKFRTELDRAAHVPRINRGGDDLVRGLDRGVVPFAGLTLFPDLEYEATNAERGNSAHQLTCQDKIVIHVPCIEQVTGKNGEVVRVVDL